MSVKFIGGAILLRTSETRSRSASSGVQLITLRRRCAWRRQGAAIALLVIIPY